MQTSFDTDLTILRPGNGMKDGPKIREKAKGSSSKISGYLDAGISCRLQAARWRTEVERMAEKWLEAESSVKHVMHRPWGFQPLKWPHARISTPLLIICCLLSSRRRFLCVTLQRNPEPARLRIMSVSILPSAASLF
jgi:hypothetical protein